MSGEREFTEARAEAKRAEVEFVPVRAYRGRVTHATTLGSANRTACDRGFKRLIVVARPLDCPDCVLAVGLDARPKKSKRRRVVR